MHYVNEISIDLKLDPDLIKKQYLSIVGKHPLRRRHLDITKVSTSLNKKYEIDDTFYYDIITINDVKYNVDGRHYTEIHDYIRGTIFEELCYELKSKYKVGLMRFVEIPPFFIYSLHTDFDDNIHLPVIASSSGCMFEKKDVTWFEEGKLYYCKTAGYTHTYFNCSREESRVHLLASVYFDRTVPLVRENQFINWNNFNII